MRCPDLKILLLLFLLALLPLHFSHSLTSSEAAELMAILQDYKSATTELKTAIDEIDGRQETLSGILSEAEMKTKGLELELERQGVQLASLKKQTKDLSDSYEKIQKPNRILKILSIAAGGFALGAVAISVFM